MAINVVAEDFMGTSFPMYGILGAMTWLVDTAEIVAGGTTGFSGSQTIDDPDVGLVTIAANVTGTDIEYNELGGITYVSGGILEALTYTVTVPVLGTVTLFEASNGNFDAADLVAARLAELEGNATAIEDFFMGFDYNFTLGSEDEDVPVGSLFGDDLAEWNLRGDDVVYAGDGKDRFFLGDGDDRGYGEKGSDTLQGGDGKDKLYGGKGGDTLEGGKGTDRLYGGKGDDEMNGGKGTDRLFNGEGSDTFIGGGGDDRFIFKNDSELVGTGDTNTIVEFENGGDKIYLGGIDANTNTGGDDDFVFIGSAGFSDTAGELKVKYYNDGTARVRGDVDGDGSYDFQIFITDYTGTFTESDFQL